METTQVRHCGFNINCRTFAPWLDLNILTQLIGCDEYGINELNQVAVDVKTILDIGGHIGGFGLIAKSLWPDAYLIAVEPNPDNHALYVKNLKENGLYDKCRVIQGAVGYDKDKTTLIHAPSTTGGDVILSKEEAEKYVREDYRFYNSIDVENVKIYTIEELTDGIEVIDLAKWDCEGAESDCFKNITKECALKFRFMVGEYHLWGKDGLYLKASKFDCYEFWKMAKRKFNHLNFSYKGKSLGLFQAWPKQVS